MRRFLTSLSSLALIGFVPWPGCGGHGDNICEQAQQRVFECGSTEEIAQLWTCDAKAQALATSYKKGTAGCSPRSIPRS